MELLAKHQIAEIRQNLSLNFQGNLGVKEYIILQLDPLSKNICAHIIKQRQGVEHHYISVHLYFYLIFFPKERPITTILDMVIDDFLLAAIIITG